MDLYVYEKKKILMRSAWNTLPNNLALICFS